jgi:hypothetical protein
MDSATARRLHDGEGRRGAMAMGCGDGSSKAREGASAARDGATATRRRAAFLRGESDLSSFRTIIRDNQTRHELLIRAASPIFSQCAQKETTKTSCEGTKMSCDGLTLGKIIFGYTPRVVLPPQQPFSNATIEQV